MKEVQAFITNISFPKTLDEFLFFLEDNFHFNVDDILEEEYVEWTAPRWSKINDIVFFMHAKTAISTINRLKKEFYNTKENYTQKQCELIEKGFAHALDNYTKYGGKIYAIGKIVDSPFYDDFYREKTKIHWGGRIYAPISDIIVLKKPIEISEFNDFIFISRQSSVTGVFGKEYMKLKEIIISKNKTKKYFEDSISAALPVKDINETNWLQLSNEFRRSFFLESQFRSYYTDYILGALTDNKVYRECICQKNNEPDCFVDNVIIFNGRPLLVEIKLNVNNEKDILGQMSKYCSCDRIKINNKLYPINNCYSKKAIVIDTKNIYLFDNKTKKIKPIIDLNQIKSNKDIDRLKKITNNNLTEI